MDVFVLTVRLFIFFLLEKRIQTVEEEAMSNKN